MNPTLKRKRFLAAFPFLLFLVLAATTRADEILLEYRDAADHGLVVSHVDLTFAAGWCNLDGIAAERARAVDAAGQDVPCQFVPDPDFDEVLNAAGTVILQLPPGTAGQLRLSFDKSPEPTAAPFDGTVSTKNYEIVQTPDRLGGLPSKITFTPSGKVFDSFRWNDRTYNPGQGGYLLLNDKQAKVERVADGPMCTVVRTSARFMQGNNQPASKPSAVYQWYYFHNLPLVYVTVLQKQRDPFAWKEWHFLELIYPDKALTKWAGAAPPAQGDVAGSGNSTRFSDWAALLDGRNAVGVMRSGRLTIHDGNGAYGTYLHAFSDVAWGGFDGTERELAAWLWIGCDDEPASAIATAAENLPTDAHVTVSVATVRNRLAELQGQLKGLDAPSARVAWWRLAAAEQLERQGRYREALSAAEGTLPENWVSLTVGDLALSLEQNASGLQMQGLADLQKRQQLLAAKPLPLFQTVVRNSDTKEELTITADSGWSKVEARSNDSPEGRGLRLEWKEPTDKRLAGMTVTVTAAGNDEANRIEWDLLVKDVPKPWGVWRTVFPQVALAQPGPEAEVFYPRGSGEVKSGAWAEAFHFSGTYPSGWMSMPFMAVYDRQVGAGLYAAIHDPWAGTKDLLAESRPAERAVVFSFDIPAANMGQPGTGYDQQGSAVWQLLRGDWFDASVIYRDWVRQNARWYPKLGPDGREDTPKWMRELSCWALAHGTPEQVVPITKKFQEALGLPVGVHWYNWHEIPFDNDYPHYFPTKPGFAEGVAELQAADVFVMPYINGRLWDTHDRGKDVFQFDDVARPAVTKDEAGEPYTEMYGSKESDGSRVSLGVMCPTTDLWQGKVGEIVLRLMNECGVRGVYIDQVAAAKPLLCFDASHGHPLGGGHWWTTGYWDMLTRIRREMPEDRMLTTECNGEAYTQVFDGYLTWHWQYNGQAPAFPAVYGGAIQMFGRAYRGGPTKDLALRMKAGQQLVFGEQIGWLSPHTVNEPENMAFLRQVVHQRARLVDYFVRGEMARPPRLEGDLPTVTADWQWSGVWPVTTEAVMAGVWRLPKENRVVLLFVNVSDEPVHSQFKFDPAEYGLNGNKLKVRKLTPDGEEPAELPEEWTFRPREIQAWEIAGGAE